MKRILYLLFISALLFSCEKPEDKAKEEDNSIKVSSVSLNKSKLTLTEGESFNLVATILPEDATDQDVTWNSSDDSVASVSDGGTVLARKEGNAAITVTTHDGGKTASCAVTVEAQLDPSVTIGATHISCISAVLSGKANLGKTTAADLKMGIMYSKSSGVLPSTSTMVEATDIEAEYYYNIQITGLEPATTYYYRSYVYQGGQNTYGDTKSFTTRDEKSLVSALAAETISPISAQALASVDLTDVPYKTIDSKGFRYWNDQSSGEVAASLVADSEGNANSRLQTYLLNLSPNTTYKYCPYISIDGRRFQGDTTSFITKSIEGLIETKEATEGGPTGATLNGTLDLADCQYSYLSYGFCYSEGQTDNPSIFRASSNLKDNAYSLTLSNLPSGKQYSFAACVKFNSSGSIRYLGSVKTFYTDMVAVDSVRLNKTELTLLTGNSTTLQATVWPAIATNKNITWKSSNEAVATITSSGVLRTINPGNATITVTTEEGAKTASCKVAVVNLSETLEAEQVSSVSAVLNARARLDLYYSGAVAGIEYSKNADMSSASRITSSNIDAEHRYSISISNLDPGTKYYYRSYVYYSSTYTYGEVQLLETKPKDVLISSMAVSDLLPKSATLNARLNLTDCVYSSMQYGFKLKESGALSANTYAVTNLAGGEFSYSATKLSPNTKYSFAAYVTLESKTYMTEWTEFTTPAIEVAISLNEPTNITELKATISGKLNLQEGNYSSSAKLYYKTETSAVQQLINTGTSVSLSLGAEKSFSKQLTGLTPDQLYYYVVVATVDGINFYSEISSFTTKSIDAVVVTSSCENPGISVATISGSFEDKNIESFSKSVWFLWSKTASTLADLKTSGTKVSASLDNNGVFTASLKSLSSETMYYYVACSKVRDKEFYGEVKAFTTMDLDDVVSLTTNAASGIQVLSATLNGALVVNSTESLSKTVWFLWSETATTIDGLRTVGKKANCILNSEGAFSTTLTSLPYGAPIHYIACSKVYDKVFYGEVISLSTINLDDVVNNNTEAVSDIDHYSATLKGYLSVDTNEQIDKSVWFLWSKTASTIETLKINGTKVTCSLNSDGTYSKKITSLNSHVCFYYVAVAQVYDKEYYGQVEYWESDGAIDLGLSVFWGTSNLNVSGLCANAQDYGQYYAWGEIEPKSDYSWSTYKWCNGSYKTLTKYNTSSSYGTVDNKAEFKDYNYEDDAARKKLGSKWRIPTDAEWTELMNNCTWTWTSNYNGTGVAGRIVTSNKTGYKDKSIFLPAAGCRTGTSTNIAGVKGCYSSSSISSDLPECASGVIFDLDTVEKANFNRECGRSVRPVME